MNDQWLFVYGTLRPGSWNWPLLRGALLMAPFENVSASGRMYHMQDSKPDEPVYPVVDFEESGIVIGTLLLVDTTRCQMAHEMELRTGYRAVTVSVQVPGWHHKTDAVSYHYPHKWRGPVVPSGDWMQVCRAVGSLPEGAG